MKRFDNLVPTMQQPERATLVLDMNLRSNGRCAMNLLRDVIEKDNDFSINGRSNLNPWSHNLKFEIGRLEKEDKIKIWHYDMNKIYSKIDAIQVNLRTSPDTKNLCLQIWDDLLKELTKVFDLKYEIK